MLQTAFLIGMVVFFACAIISRMLGEQAYRRLTNDEKLRLVDGFSRERMFSMIPIVVMLGAFFLLQTQSNWDQRWVGIGFFGLLIVYSLVKGIMQRSRLVQLEMPAAYRRRFFFAQGIAYFGMAVLMSCLLLNY
jgi:hypothetical protein